MIGFHLRCIINITKKEVRLGIFEMTNRIFRHAI